MQTPESPPLAAVQAQLQEVLAHFPNVTRALPFGSVAASRACSDSNLDIAMLAQSPQGAAQHIALTQALAEKTGYLIDLATAPEPLLGK